MKETRYNTQVNVKLRELVLWKLALW